jgi:phosphoribosylformimino-5-aminoimidazole carboxamide ribotide isomerase
MIEFWMDNGINRVILGTAAVRDPLLVRQACEKFPGKIAVSVDAVNGIVAVDGWTETTKISAHSICTDLEKTGVSAIIFTDIDRDGTLRGPNIGSTRDLASRVKMPVILSGGVSSLEDLRELKEKAPMLEGVICGRALYDGRLDPAAAVALLRGK